jgi:hypothetical protein
MEEHSVLAQIEAGKSWHRARQAAGIEAILDVIRTRSHDLLPFDEVQKSLRLSSKSYRGLQDIPLAQIRGSVGRYRDFTGTFLPKKEELGERWKRVSMVASTIGIPPIEVYQVGEAYFVMDGNHRVSVATQNAQGTIQAYVWEFVTPVGLSSTADLDELLIRAEYTEFLDHTRLDKLRPEQKIEFTTPGRYRELEYQIVMYRQILEQIDGEPATYEDAVTAWYDMVYTPAVQIIQERGTLERFPGRTEADLFIWVWRHRQDLQQSGEATSLARIADELPQEGLRGTVSRLWQWLGRWLRRD